MNEMLAGPEVSCKKYVGCVYKMIRKCSILTTSILKSCFFFLRKFSISFQNFNLESRISVVAIIRAEREKLYDGKVEADSI